MSGLCYMVPGMDRLTIRHMAESVRKKMNITDPWFPITEYMEFYQEIDPEFHFDVREPVLMGADHGLTFPDEKKMWIREDVYDRAASGAGRDRMTIAHEFGHLFMHRNLGFARQFPEDQVQTFCSSEWQAKCFAGELLISARHMHLCRTVEDVVREFGVSLDAANYHWRKVWKK